MRILGIETSCDETAAAVIEAKSVEQRAKGLKPYALSSKPYATELKVLSNVVASQIKIHAKTGGVVPEVAARAHVEKILPVVEAAMQNAECRMQNLGSDIDAIAVTAGPGLMTSLLVGVEVARTLSALWKKPLIGVNHLAGHVYANWLPSPGLRPPSPTEGEGKSAQFPSPRGRGQGEGRMKFPALCLIVSGGHTELVLMKKHMDFKVVGSTRDDAAGEAFDKVAKMLGLSYPGGPAVAAEAEKWRMKNAKCRIKFPRPMIASPDFDFSFSGLKTSVLYYIKTLKHENIKALLPEVCYEFQEAVVDVLVSKTIRAAKQYKVKTVLLGGGVAANARLRQQLVEAIKRELPAIHYLLPSLAYTGDNAAMIAAAGYFMAQKKQFTPTPKQGRREPLVWGFTPWEKIDVDPNWELGSKIKNRI